MQIAFFELEPWDEDYIKQKLNSSELFAQVQPSFYRYRLTLDKGADHADVEAVSVFIYSNIDAALLKILPKLRLLLTRSKGFDHIDLAACQKQEITVCNVPHYGENTVAEHTFALILALSRKVHHAHVRAQQSDFSIEGLRGFDLYGKTLGVIGTGNIGLHVIRIARGFGMRVLAYDVQPDPLVAEVLSFNYTDLENLLRESGIVSLHVPATPQTHHMINQNTLSIMKRGSLLINTARGSVVDTAAVLWALEEGILGGMGIDVIEGEEFIKQERELLASSQAPEVFRQVVQAHLLLRGENVVFTPHIAFNSWQALYRILDTTLQNLKAYLRGQPISAPNPDQRTS